MNALRVVHSGLVLFSSTFDMHHVAGKVVNLMGLAVVFFEDAEFLRIDDNSIEWVHWTGEVVSSRQ